MVWCNGMGDDIDTNGSEAAMAVLEFMMTYGICPKDLERIKNICSTTPPDEWGELCTAYNDLDGDAKNLINDFIENMEGQTLSLKKKALKPLIGYALKPGAVRVSKKETKKPKKAVKKKPGK